MDTLKFNLTKKGGKFKILNATNGGPVHKRHVKDQWRSNFDDYKAARMPYARNHDSAHSAIYGGHYAHDITAIFPNFDADVNDPASYEFACTDEAILTCLETGTKTFYRLGQSIEHQIKKYGVLPPKDFQKWAEICEHIIAHYTEGWADGYELDMPYWEIWNEADLDAPLDSTKNRTWGGTPEEFFDLYATAATHLKGKFPHLKIGGPALAYRNEWAEEFLAEMRRREVPIDFFSWHIYGETPEKVAARAEEFDAMLKKYGYEDAESILNEWNYVKNWEDKFVYSIEAIHGMKGAAFTMAVMSLAQQSPIDMLMYYDTLPNIWNGAFDFYTLRPLKGYYPLKWYGDFYDLDAEIRAENSFDNIYTLCGVSDEGKITCILTYFDDDDTAGDREIALDFGRDGEYDIYLLDEEHDSENIGTKTDLCFSLKRNSCVLIKER